MGFWAESGIKLKPRSQWCSGMGAWRLHPDPSHPSRRRLLSFLSSACVSLAWRGRRRGCVLTSGPPPPGATCRDFQVTQKPDTMVTVFPATRGEGRALPPGTGPGASEAVARTPLSVARFLLLDGGQGRSPRGGGGAHRRRADAHEEPPPGGRRAGPGELRGLHSRACEAEGEVPWAVARALPSPSLVAGITWLPGPAVGAPIARRPRVCGGGPLGELGPARPGPLP